MIRIFFSHLFSSYLPHSFTLSLFLSHSHILSLYLPQSFFSLYLSTSLWQSVSLNLSYFFLSISLSLSLFLLFLFLSFFSRYASIALLLFLFLSVFFISPSVSLVLSFVYSFSSFNGRYTFWLCSSISNIYITFFSCEEVEINVFFPIFFTPRKSFFFFFKSRANLLMDFETYMFVYIWMEQEVISINYAQINIFSNIEIKMQWQLQKKFYFF